MQYPHVFLFCLIPHSPTHAPTPVFFFFFTFNPCRICLTFSLFFLYRLPSSLLISPRLYSPCPLALQFSVSFLSSSSVLYFPGSLRHTRLSYSCPCRLLPLFFSRYHPSLSTYHTLLPRFLPSLPTCSPASISLPSRHSFPLNVSISPILPRALILPLSLHRFLSAVQNRSFFRPISLTHRPGPQRCPPQRNKDQEPRRIREEREGMKGRFC